MYDYGMTPSNNVHNSEMCLDMKILLHVSLNSQLMVLMPHIVLPYSLKVMSTIASQLKALSQNTPQSSITL